MFLNKSAEGIQVSKNAVHVFGFKQIGGSERTLSACKPSFTYGKIIRNVF